MSVRQRVTLKFASEDQEDDHILDEQEQEELIQDLRKRSDAQNTNYNRLMHAVLALSATLHLVYLFGLSEQPPTAALFSSNLPLDGFRPIPGYHFFSLLHIFVHLNISGHLLPSSHKVRQWFSRHHTTPYTFFLPLPFPILFGLSALAPSLSVLMVNGWYDVAWWSATAVLSWFVYTMQGWMRAESEGLRTLERLKYNSKGA